jgi:broad specificity phosphatase PhoE
MKHDEKAAVRLYLVRHGETAGNAQMRYLGTRDEPLTEIGTWQAIQTAEALSRLPVKAVISSPKRRAADTAMQVQKACGIELRLDARLAEGSFGRWEGLSRAEVLNLGNPDAELLARWETDSSCAPPGGESIEDIQRRVISLVEELKMEFPASSIVLVSHVGPIKALLAAASGFPPDVSRSRHDQRNGVGAHPAPAVI